MAEIRIYANEQLDGYTYSLDPQSRALVERHEADTAIVNSVFISFDTKLKFEAVHGSQHKHVVEMLTGLGMGEIAALGKVVFVDPKTDRPLFAASGQNV